jgi:anthranilate synthase component 1
MSIRPNFTEFRRLARSATLVPVVKTIPADLITPVAAFLAVAQKESHAFLFESVEGGEKVGRYTFLGVRPGLILSARGDRIQVQQGKKTRREIGDVLHRLRQILSAHTPAKLPGLPPFTGGAVGYFAYDFVRRLEKLPSRAQDDLHLPDCFLMFFDRILAFDHIRHEIHLIATVDVTRGASGALYEKAGRDIAALERLLHGSGKPPRVRRSSAADRPLRIQPTTPKARFLRDVARVKEYIRAGDVFQTVLSQRFELEPGVPPFEIYRALRAVNPSPYLYYLRMGQAHIVGSSPEMLIKVNGDELQYRPIAGTRPRHPVPARDHSLEADLLADEKERAEHVMLVDLGRNDLGRVSRPGTVKVRDFMFVERYSHVMHLVSALEGRLQPGLAPLDAFASCFPAGTLTGAPKVRSMQIIEELEPVRRGVYGGSVLYADFAGNLDSCIAIRTLVMKGKRAFIQAGAGIVADSVPRREYDECLNKARALIRAVEKARGRE